MRRVGFEHTTAVFERAKTVHALDRAVTVIESKFGDSWDIISSRLISLPLVQIMYVLSFMPLSLHGM
jgi:hypothetical protein